MRVVLGWVRLALFSSCTSSLFSLEKENISQSLWTGLTSGPISPLPFSAINCTSLGLSGGTQKVALDTILTQLLDAHYTKCPELSSTARKPISKYVASETKSGPRPRFVYFEC